MASKDSALMTAVIVGGAAAVIGSLYMISKAKAGSPMIASQPINGVGAVIAFQPSRRRLSGWGSYGTPGFNGMGRTGAAVYWRRVN